MDVYIISSVNYPCISRVDIRISNSLSTDIIIFCFHYSRDYCNYTVERRTGYILNYVDGYCIRNRNCSFVISCLSGQGEASRWKVRPIEAVRGSGISSQKGSPVVEIHFGKGSVRIGSVCSDRNVVTFG